MAQSSTHCSAVHSFSFLANDQQRLFSAGMGVVGQIEGKAAMVGNIKLLEHMRVACTFDVFKAMALRWESQGKLPPSC